MSLAISRYEPTTEEIDGEARIFEREGCERGPLHALLVQRIRFKMLEVAYVALNHDFQTVFNAGMKATAPEKPE